MSDRIQNEAAFPSSDLAPRSAPIIERAPLPIVEVQGRTHIVSYVNAAFCSLLEKPRKDLIGKPFDKIVPSGQECLPILDRVYETGEASMLAKKDEADPAHWLYAMWPTLDEEERPVGVIIQLTKAANFHQNITEVNEALLISGLRQHQMTEEAEHLNAQLTSEISERKKAEQKLRGSEERYRNLFNSMDEGCCIIELIYDGQTPVDWRFLEVNPAFEKQTGLSNATGKRVREFAPDHEAYWFEIYDKVVRTGEPVRFVNEAKSMGRWFDLYAFRVGDAKSRKVAILFTDITARRNSEELLKKAKEQMDRHAVVLEKQVGERTADLIDTNEQLSAFVYSIAHDLRAPLRSMQGFSQLLVEDYAGLLDDEGRNFLSRIQISSEFMDKMILDLLAFGSVGRRDTNLERVPVDLAWSSALFQYSTQINYTGAQIETTGTLPFVCANQATLAQILANLLSNAMKFVPAGVPPKIRFWAEDRGQMVRLWIEDNGIGISIEHQERAFRVFERLQGARFPGTGIGLSIVRKGAERMGGKAGVESKPGEGSKFWIELQKA